MRTGIIHDDLFLQHETGPFHPERKERLISIHEGLRSYAHSNQLHRLKPRLAAESELRLIHPPPYIRNIQATAGKESTQLDPDTVASARSCEVAQYAVGSLLVLIDALLAGEIDNGFALVRPPGHHAEPNRVMGFCLFSNIAIGSAYALQKHKLSRVLVIDFDVHHGNGTQKAFYHRGDVLYISTHQFPLYPGTGDYPEIGEGAGKGFTVNFPLPSRTGDAIYNLVFEKVVAPIAQAYRPDLILVSAGYDAHVDDPLAGMEVTAEGFASISQTIVGLADKLCGGKVIFLLEGGYHLKGLQMSVLKSLDVLTGQKQPSRRWKPDASFEAVLEKSRRTFGSYWKF
ncbi:MAG: histone deacetylase [Acidobacteria bacterium]|nr:histone deacetylase [Acidobacteriota bacterium]MCI0624871.1 histone deacetylase [Acidobacteriota bacterium]MCI0724414.1 histone deacetylase [Acidobacteriota bacterium]